MKVGSDVLTKEYEDMDVDVLVGGKKYYSPARINFVSSNGKECSVVFEDEPMKSRNKTFVLQNGDWVLASPYGLNGSRDVTLVIPTLPEVDLPPEDR